ncbi:lactate utilization protein [Acidobacteria bacterium AH-259-O06]|nr:lactate utilization protein [Acidobacteria bacterium AH-259-O06]
MSRSAMLEKVRRACDQAEGVELPGQSPQFPQYTDPVAKFRQELERTGGVFFDARQPKELPAVLTSVMKQSDSTEIYWEDEQLFQRHGLPFTLRNPEAFAKGFLVYSFHFRQEMKLPILLNSKRYERSELARVSLSASSAGLGVAETGSVVHEVRSGAGRLLSVLPPAHVVFLSEKDLLMNHAELFRSLPLGQYGSALTLVTGPSRTADIEKTLVIGVHGPKQLFVILTS